MDDEDVARFIGIGLAATAVYGGWRWMQPRMAGWGESASTSASHLWHEVWWIVAAFVVLMIAMKVALWRLDRRNARRSEVAEVLAAKVGKVMPAGWDPIKQFQVRAWDGMSPKALRIRLVPACDVDDLDWRRAVVRASGIQARPDWDRVSAKRVLDLVPGAEQSGTDERHGDATLEAVEGSLTGLVPGARVTTKEDGTLVVSYGETTRDQSSQWRQRVVEQISARTGERWRGEWDRRQRTVTLCSVPELPAMLDWAEASAKARSQLCDPRMVPYGMDEDGRWTCWHITTKSQPHGIVAGTTGSGKTETMKSIVNGFLLMGGLVGIGDPKKQDFAEYLGRPGVLAVATDIADRAGLLMDMMAEVHRRNAMIAAAKLVEDHPELADLAGDTDLRFQPLLVVLDEVTQHNADLSAWFAGLDPEERAKWGGNPKSAKPTDLAGIPAQIAQLARAADIHLLLGMQRADASNFGDNTSMRDNMKHIVTQAATSAISSEMLWGDRITGSAVEILSPGEGVTNAARVDEQGHTIMPGGTPGRYKAMYVGTASRGDAFWDQVAAVAPDATAFALPHVSSAARDPEAALRELLAVVGHKPAPTSRPSFMADEESQAAVVETDTAGITWEGIAATSLQAGDIVSVGDIHAAVVVDVEGWVVDDYTGDDVFRVVLNEDGQESCVDLAGEERVERRM